MAEITYREIEYFLYNYKKFDNMIKKIEEKYIGSINVTLNTWLKSRYDDNRSFENQVTAMADDKRIIRYKKWQAFIKNMLAYFYVYSPIYYEFIDLKYFKKKSNNYIKNEMNIDSLTLRDIRESTIAYIISKAKEEKLDDGI